MEKLSGFSDIYENIKMISSEFKERLAELDKPLNSNMENQDDGTTLARCPENNGQWDGERGKSNWYPDRDYIPPEKSRNPIDSPYSNPDNLTWGEILDKYGIECIPFKDGYPDFSAISKATVKIEGFETGNSVAKVHNFEKANIELAKETGYSIEEIEEWMDENNYTWHECEDKKTMQKVPNEIHANIPHDGGRSMTE